MRVPLFLAALGVAVSCSVSVPDAVDTPVRQGDERVPAHDEDRERLTAFDPVGGGDDPSTVIWLVLDTVRADSMGVYGGRVEMPHLEAFADSAVVVERAFSHAPETCVSHWTMLTGVLPEVHGSVPKQRSTRYAGPAMGDIARSVGLPTAGFTAAPTLMRGVCGLSGFDDWREDFPFETDASPTAPGVEVAAAAAAWMGEQEGDYFLFVNLFDAHSPYTPPAPWDTAFDPDYSGDLDGSMASLEPWMEHAGASAPESERAHGRALYDGEIGELDAMIGVVLDAAPDDAVVVITADHGESFEHGYLFNHRDVMWDGVLRVPLLVRSPDLQARHADDGFFSHLDLAPTVADLAGWPVDRGMMGESRVAWLAGEPDASSPAVHHARVHPWEGEGDVAVRSSDRKLIFDDGRRDEGRLYDLVADPEELEPTGGSAAPELAAYAAYRATIGDAENRVRPYEPQPPSDELASQIRSIGYIE